MVIEKLVYKNFLKYTLLISFLYMPIFGHLDALPLRIWDEARLAMNAYEMYNNNEFIVTYFDGAPDMWNTKPPLMIWLQVLFMKIIGVNVIAVRLPSAIAAFLTCIALVIFASKFLNSFWFGFISVLVLITSQGYIDMHTTRTGDYDSLLAFLTTVGCLFLFIYLANKNIKFLYDFFTAISLAVLTKGIAGLLVLPGIVAYVFLKKQLFVFLKNRHFYIGLISTVIIITSYYLIREIRTPGYLYAVWQNELGGRYLESLEGNQHEFLFYYKNIIHWQFSEWYLFIPCGILIGYFIKNEYKISKLLEFSLLISLTYILIISLSKTKIYWYSLPLFPFLAIIVAVCIHFIFDFLKTNSILKNRFKNNIIPVLFLFLIFILPYNKIIDKTYHPQELAHEKDFYEIGHYLRDAVKGKINVNGYYLSYKDYNAHNKFYLIMLNNKGINISLKDWRQFEAGDKVLASQDHVKEFINKNYHYEILDRRNTVVQYKIIGKL